MKRTPTGSAAIFASWIALLSGISLAAFFYGSKSWSILLIILATSFITAVILRVLANINEFLFNLNSNYSLVNKIDEESQTFKGMDPVFQNLESINNEIHKLTSFFGQIEKHLDLKK